MANAENLYVSGLCIGKGWYHLIDELCQRIQNNVDTRGSKQIEVLQVKEKFGSLCFYTKYHDNAISKIIQYAEYKAANVRKWATARASPREAMGKYPIFCM